ncbi:MAG: Heparinase II/III-like protein [Syntrophus sp. PtaB.Bin138]|nr:MAG: Heparinase II/III-like protein [Syntrophus sp. PtaB.Bin138]
MNADCVTHRTFARSGYTVARAERGLFLTLDHGLLGMSPLCNHGHADALSVTVSVKGVPFLVDTGTYRYNGAPDYRKYFKGTRAHNTVTVDGRDQAIQVTSFIWGRSYQARLTRTETRVEGLFLEVAHDGYTRLKSPVVHRRALLVGSEGSLLVRDTFSGTGSHDFEQNFHLHPEVRATRSGEWWRLEAASVACHMRQMRGKALTLHAGEEDPPFGWHSPSYGLKVKSGVLSSRDRGPAAGVLFITAFCTGEPPGEDILKELASGL